MESSVNLRLTLEAKFLKINPKSNADFLHDDCSKNLKKFRKIRKKTPVPESSFYRLEAQYQHQTIKIYIYFLRRQVSGYENHRRVIILRHTGSSQVFKRVIVHTLKTL